MDEHPRPVSPKAGGTRTGHLGDNLVCESVGQPPESMNSRGGAWTVTDMNNGQKLSRKDFEDYEFIVAELARMAKMNFAEIREHQKQHPEENLYTLHHPKDNHLMLFTREGMKRFWQVAGRGMKSLGPESRKYDLKSVVSEIQRAFLTRLLDNPPSINDEHAHDIFVQVIAKISAAFVPSTHYVPCRLVAHTSPSQFRIGPVEFQLSQALWKDYGEAILESLRHESQHEPIEQFFTQQMWVASVQVGPCDSVVGAGRATEAIQSSLDLFKLIAGSRGARVGHFSKKRYS